MGTAISLDSRDEQASAADFEQFFALIRDVDARFSMYRADSEASRFVRGELAESGLSDQFTEVLELCATVRGQSDGAFDISAHSREGHVDPTGLVKGWAVDRGAELLKSLGWNNFCVNAGGDVFASGSASPGRPWRIGIRHPIQADKMAGIVEVEDLAVATSGAYERGEHIIDPQSGDAPPELLSMSVVGPNLTFADAYATAAFVKGRTGVAWVASLDGYEAFAATADGRAVWTDGWERLRA